MGKCYLCRLQKSHFLSHISLTCLFISWLTEYSLFCLLSLFEVWRYLCFVDFFILLPSFFIWKTRTQSKSIISLPFFCRILFNVGWEPMLLIVAFWQLKVTVAEHKRHHYKKHHDEWVSAILQVCKKVISLTYLFYFLVLLYHSWQNIRHSVLWSSGSWLLIFWFFCHHSFNWKSKELKQSLLYHCYSFVQSFVMTRESLCIWSWQSNTCACDFLCVVFFIQLYRLFLNARINPFLYFSSDQFLNVFESLSQSLGIAHFVNMFMLNSVIEATRLMATWMHFLQQPLGMHL